jgi:hypothetical protein
MPDLSSLLWKKISDKTLPDLLEQVAPGKVICEYPNKELCGICHHRELHSPMEFEDMYGSNVKRFRCTTASSCKKVNGIIKCISENQH